MELNILLFLFAGIVLISSIIGFVLTKKIYVTPAIIFVLFSFLMLFFFNETFFVWVLIYTCFSIFITLIMFLYKKSRNRNINIEKKHRS